MERVRNQYLLPAWSNLPLIFIVLTLLTVDLRDLKISKSDCRVLLVFGKSLRIVKLTCSEGEEGYQWHHEMELVKIDKSRYAAL